MIRFGPSGNCEAFYEAGLKHTYEEPKWLSSQGLTAFEYSFGLGSFLKTETALKIGEEAKKYGVEVSVHAPYFINFANTTEKSILNNSRYVLESLRNLKEMGGRHCVIHVGSQLKLERQEAIETVKQALLKVMQEVDVSEYKGLYVCPEALGKYKQIGSHGEIFDICSVHDMLIPTLDFGHINCLLQGALKSKQDYLDILKEGIDKLGYERMNDLHIHFSKIMYNDKGEVKHLTFDDDVYGPNFEPMIDAILELNLHPVIISESAGTQSRDALIMKNYLDTKLQ